MPVRLLALLAALVLVALPAGVGLAQEAGDAADAAATELSLPSVSVGDYPEVTVSVTAPREFAEGVPAEAFELTENGRPRDVEVQRLPTDDLEVAVVIDTSGSMGVAPMEAAKTAALEFTDRMPAAVAISVIEFNTATAVISDFTTDRAETREAISGLASGGRTALYEGVHLALDLFDGRDPARRAIVLLSDGGDNESGATLTETFDRLEGRDEVMHIIELVTAEIDADALRQLAASADGEVVSAEDPDALSEVYEEIASKLVNRYELTYTSEAHGRTLLNVRLAHEDVVAEGARHAQLPPPPPPDRLVDPDADEPDEAEAAPVLPDLRDGDVLRPGFFARSWVLYVGATIFYLALALAILLLLAPRRRRTTLDRARRHVADGRTAVTGLAERATALADRALGHSERRSNLDRSLERAGIHLRASEWVVLVGSAAVTALAIGWLLGGPLLALLLAVAAVLGSRLVLSIMVDRRRAQFAEQLSDTLQLLAGSLRAGYGIMQAVDAVAKEADPPTSEEFQRLLVETRLGRDLNEALHGIADRTDSEDFDWIVQAIDIHREVGGDLAEILDTVASTIRERTQLGRQVKALSAEGRLSAVILFLLPFVVAGILRVVNPDYVSELYTTTPGLMMLGAGGAFMAVGGLWLRRIVRLVY